MMSYVTGCIETMGVNMSTHLQMRLGEDDITGRRGLIPLAVGAL